MTDKEMASDCQKMQRAECQIIFAEIKLRDELVLARMDTVEKEVKKLKYIILTALVALQAILPNGVRSLIDLFNKVP